MAEENQAPGAAEDEAARVERAATDRDALEALIEDLSDRSRRKRQLSAHVIALLADREPELLVPYIKELVDALKRPEAQTRWEVLDALTRLVDGHAHEVGCPSALEDAEIALFDELSAPLHLSAFRFLTVWGASERRRSEKIWPIIDEAIQCYHGDLEYRDMLALLADFAGGQIAGSVANQLAGRLRFDAENGKDPYVKARSKEIYDALVKRFKLSNPQKRSRVVKQDDDDEGEDDEE